MMLSFIALVGSAWAADAPGQGVVRSSVAERVGGPRVMHRVWWEGELVAVNAGFTVLGDFEVPLVGDLGVRTRLPGDYALLCSTSLDRALWATGLGVARPVGPGMQASATAVLLAL